MKENADYSSSYNQTWYFYSRLFFRNVALLWLELSVIILMIRFAEAQYYSTNVYCKHM